MWTELIGLRLRHFLASASREVVVICPFVQLPALRLLLDRSSAEHITVITRWRTEDINAGVSDVRIYEYLKARGARLFVHDDLHLKLFIADESMVLSTANVSLRALGLLQNASIEGAHYPEPVTEQIGRFVSQITTESTPVDDNLYCKALQIAQERGRTVNSYEADGCLLSTLPLSRTLSDLMLRIRLASSGTGSADPVLAHDVRALAIDAAAPLSTIRFEAQKTFLSSSVVKALTDFLNRPRYFGEIKRWLQRECGGSEKVGIRSLTPYVQAMYGWLKETNSNCVISRPRHSERIGLLVIPPDFKATDT